MNDELQYQGMNLKTLAALTGVPYTTITNGRNRPDSIPTADIAIKIAKVLNKSLEWLLGEQASLPSAKNPVSENEKINRELRLYHKYEGLISSLESFSVRTQESFKTLAVSLNEEIDRKKQ